MTWTTPQRVALTASLLALAAAWGFAQSQDAPQAPQQQQTPAPVVRVAPDGTTTPVPAPKPKPKPLQLSSPATDSAGLPAGGGAAAATASPLAAPAPKPRPVPKVIESTPAITPGSASAQPLTPMTGPINRNTIVLDPAHGGVDSGSRISDNVLEKDVTLAFAFKLRSMLNARGFNVVMTRDSDTVSTPGAADPTLSLDERAGIANHARPVACLLLHATGAGEGVHLYTSELDPAPGEATLLPWLTAQAAWVPQSQRLEKQLATALGRSRVLLVSATASVRPVDSLTCPAVVVELAPNGDDASSINNGGYQQRVAQSIADALVFWENQAQPPVKLAAPPAASSASTAGKTGTTP